MNFRLLVDEDLPRSTARFLRANGFEAEDVRDIGLRGASDTRVFAAAQGRGAALLTADIGFSNALRYRSSPHMGIIISRIPDDVSPEELNRQILVALKNLTFPEVASAIVVVELGRIRIRHF